jgi:hypothetical protein
MFSNRRTSFKFACRYCSKELLSEAGRRSHVQQTAACREKMMEAHTSPSLRAPKRIQEYEPMHDSDVEMSDSPTPKYGPATFASDEPFPETIDNPNTLQKTSPKRQKVTVEEVEDVDAPWASRNSDEESTRGTGQSGSESGPGFEFIQDFPGEAGTPGKKRKTQFEEIKDRQMKAGELCWGPFADEDEWELARWLMTANVSQNRRDAFLKLPIVCPYTISSSLSHVRLEDTRTCTAIIS